MHSIRHSIRQMCNRQRRSDFQLLLGRGAIRGIALQFADGVRHGGPDRFEILHGTGGAAGEIQNQSAIADSTDGAGEHGEGSLGEAGGAHGFAEARDDAIENLQRRLGGNIARRERRCRQWSG